MYRDEPLDDEAALRRLVGDAAVERLAGAGVSTLQAACDVAALLLGWASEHDVGAWFTREQQRLGSVSPLAALVAGDVDDVEDAARHWAAAQG